MSVILHEEDNRNCKISELNFGDYFRYTSDDKKTDEYYMKCNYRPNGGISEVYILSLEDYKLSKLEEKFPDDNIVTKLDFSYMTLTFNSRSTKLLINRDAIEDGALVYVNDTSFFVSTTEIVTGNYTFIQTLHGYISPYAKDSIDNNSSNNMHVIGFSTDMIDLYLD